MRLGHFHIPGAATRREYAVYIMVARHCRTEKICFYIGKTGDNRKGCNPVISRAGNHFSFNKIHSQMRNQLPSDPENYDFDFFYTTFGKYIDPSESRSGVNLINEMEKVLNRLAQKAFGGKVLNPYNGKVTSREKDLAIPERITQLEELVKEVKKFVGEVI
jgi:hypothetical protein